MFVIIIMIINICVKCRCRSGAVQFAAQSKWIEEFGFINPNSSIHFGCAVQFVAQSKWSGRPPPAGQLAPSYAFGHCCAAAPLSQCAIAHDCALVHDQTRGRAKRPKAKNAFGHLCTLSSCVECYYLSYHYSSLSS